MKYTTIYSPRNNSCPLPLAPEPPLSGDDLLVVSHYVEEVAKMVAQRERI